VAGTGAPEAIDAALEAVEATGIEATGIAAGLALRSALRKAWLAAGALPSEAPRDTLYGLPTMTTPIWPPGAAAGDAVVGDWGMLLVGVREDVGFDLSSEGVLVDDAGAIVVTAFQDDVTLMRCFVRVAIAVAQPVQPDGSGVVVPFKFADWTSGTAAAAEAGTSSRSRKR
jgi:hypothetical protein